MKNIDIVGTVGVPACYGGFESLVENLVTHHSEKIKYSVFCSSKTYFAKLPDYKGANLIYIPLKANGIQSILYDIVSLMYCLARQPDVTLILGVSGCIFLPVYRLFSSSRIITNIDGLEWKREKWNKYVRWFLKYSEKLAVKYSDVVVTDNQAITEYVKKEYDVESVTIAYGGDHAIPSEQISLDSLSKHCYLSVCRIEPENNIHLILDAFAQSGLPLRFIGNWQSSHYGRQLLEKYEQFTNIEMMNPVYDVKQLFALRSTCLGYIHGHSAGGTNPSLVEAMHFAKPIFVFDCSFNRFSTENKAFYFSSVNQLIDLLKQTTDSQLMYCSEQMLNIAQTRYTWSVINCQYESIY